MKRINKRDKIYLLILTIIFILVILYILKDGTLYGSILDWNNQHSIIPDYFRTLFYKTHKILPNLALNLGSGQNIYNYAYYGLLNPIILISYLLPFITMKTYIQISSILVVYFSILLFYYFLRNNKYNENISFLGTIAFFASTPLLFHSHRHIMFINYFPFLILALIGVDKYFENNNKKLLCISTLLIILSSYYFSIPSIICIVVYGIYKYLQLNSKVTFKRFINDGFKFLLPIICAVFISSILLVPTFMTLLSGRDGSNVSINLLELLTPKINIKYIYSSYGLGLTSFSLVGILNFFKTKRKENMFLSIILSLMILFPIINYILNATMYIDSKVLIPFIPLFILVEVELFNNIERLDIKHILISSLCLIFYVFIFRSEYSFIFYIDYILSIILIVICNRYKLKKAFSLIVTLSLIVLTFIMSHNDNLVPYSRYYNDTNYNQKKLSYLIPNDYNHTTLYNNNHDNVNEIYNNLNIYSNYIYSSISNKLYNKFYFDTFENNMEYRNRSLLTANKNIMYLMFSNNKYFIGDNIDIIGYNKTNQIGNTSLYKNENVLPFMYVSYNFMSSNDFNKYSFPYTNEILLKNTIINSNTFNNYETNIKQIKLNEFKIKEISENININNNEINVLKNKSKIIIDLDDLYKDKILFISFNLESQNRDLYIDINGVTNKLTNKNWKYYNGNTTFDYVLSEKYRDNLIVTLNKGKYIVDDLKIYYIDYNDIKDVNKYVTKVNVSDKSIGDKIYANVNVNRDGYFVTTIPYDKGFNIMMDNEKIDYEIVNNAFVGFKISKGYHDIEISYRSPGKVIGIILSAIGLCIYIIFIRRSNY